MTCDERPSLSWPGDATLEITRAVSWEQRSECRWAKGEAPEAAAYLCLLRRPEAAVCLCGGARPTLRRSSRVAAAGGSPPTPRRRRGASEGEKKVAGVGGERRVIGVTAGMCVRVRVCVRLRPAHRLTPARGRGLAPDRPCPEPTLAGTSRRRRCPRLTVRGDSLSLHVAGVSASSLAGVTRACQEHVVAVGWRRWSRSELPLVPRRV